MLSEGIERAAEKQKSQCLQGFPRFCRLAGRERDTPGLLPRVFCPLGRDKERRQVRRLFAAEMAAVLAAQLDRWQPTCITYLPLGFLRARERGYNQAELLARPIAQSLSLPCVSALRKRPFTARQSVQQDAAARRKNAAGSLLPGRVPLAGERVVVIDDIVTTGSTVYPKGLILGYVEDAGFDETGVAKYAMLRPAADLEDLEQVFVITDYVSE